VLKRSLGHLLMTFLFFDTYRTYYCRYNVPSRALYASTTLFHFSAHALVNGLPLDIDGIPRQYMGRRDGRKNAHYGV